MEYWKAYQHVRVIVAGLGLCSMAYGGEHGCTDKDNCNFGRHGNRLT